MKKFFMLMTFVIGMFLTTTASAANWESIGTDDLNNEYFIDTESFSLYKQEGNRRMFYATFWTDFTDAGRKSLGNENLGSVALMYAFGDYEGKKLFSLVAMKAYALDGSSLGEKKIDSPKWEEVKPKSLFEAMYDTAYKYLKS